MSDSLDLSRVQALTTSLRDHIASFVFEMTINPVPERCEKCGVVELKEDEYGGVCLVCHIAWMYVSRSTLRYYDVPCEECSESPWTCSPFCHANIIVNPNGEHYRRYYNGEFNLQRELSVHTNYKWSYTVCGRDPPKRNKNKRKTPG
jgi:hypothetical protein